MGVTLKGLLISTPEVFLVCCSPPTLCSHITNFPNTSSTFLFREQRGWQFSSAA